MILVQKSTSTSTSAATDTTNTAPSHSGPTPVTSSEKSNNNNNSKPSDSTKSTLSNDETRKTLDPKGVGSTTTGGKDTVSSDKASLPIEDKESSPSLAGSSTSTPSGTDKNIS